MPMKKNKPVTSPNAVVQKPSHFSWTNKSARSIQSKEVGATCGVNAK
jgi:hypothetical protein